MDLLNELNLARFGLNDLFETKGSFQKIGLGDLLIELASGVAGDVASFNGRSGIVVAQAGDYNTDQVTEASNLYFTNARVLTAPLTGYVSGAGVITAADTVLSAIQKLNGNITFDLAESLHIDGSNSPIANISWGGFQINDLADPTSAQDAATKAYVDSIIGADAANQSLSNLTSPTAINQDLLPSAPAGQNLGSTSFPWGSVVANSIYSPFNSAINLAAGIIIDPTGATAIDIVNRRLNDQASAAQLYWSTAGVQIGSLNGVLKATAGLVSGGASTSDLPEGSNLYYLDTRVRAAVSATSPILYDSGTGIFSAQYADATHDGVISAADWNRFNADTGIENVLVTTNTTPAPIFSVVLPDASVYYLEARVTARYADGSSVEAFHKNICVRAEVSASPSIVAPGQTTIFESNGVILSVDWVINGSSVELQVTGDTSTVNWKSFVSVYSQSN